MLKHAGTKLGAQNTFIQKGQDHSRRTSWWLDLNKHKKFDVDAVASFRAIVMYNRMRKRKNQKGRFKKNK